MTTGNFMFFSYFCKKTEDTVIHNNTHQTSTDIEKNSPRLLGQKGSGYIVPFVLITVCFALWGFANDITNPMVKAFSKIFDMSVTQGTLVQVAFYGGYFVMAFPAALFIRKFSYKSGVIMGLALYALGALLFLPASVAGMYFPFLLAYFIMTCGLSFLETSCNPYILSMGDQRTATRRLNLAQAFNPIGSLAGMFVAMTMIQNRLSPLGAAERRELPSAEFEAVKAHDLDILTTPYVYIGIFLIIMLIIILLTRMPGQRESAVRIPAAESVRRLLRAGRYRHGVVAQFFYVGAQIMCWTFIIQYGTRIFMNQGLDEKSAEILSQQYNIAAMAIFCASRFICTFLLRYFNPGRLLAILASGAALLTLGVILLTDIYGLYCLVGVSACMSLMFPTIYGIALHGLGEESKFGAAGLIMSILGGSILPPLQALVIDSDTGFMPSVNLSFVVPLFCFAVVGAYGYYAARQD